MDEGDRVLAVKVWRCGGGHALGMVVRGGREMLLFREAVRMAEGKSTGKAGEGGLAEGKSTGKAGEGGLAEEFEVMAVVVGRVVDVRCSICGRMRTWVEGTAQLRRK